MPTPTPLVFTGRGPAEVKSGTSLHSPPSSASSDAAARRGASSSAAAAAGGRGKAGNCTNDSELVQACNATQQGGARPAGGNYYPSGDPSYYEDHLSGEGSGAAASPSPINSGEDGKRKRKRGEARKVAHQCVRKASNVAEASWRKRRDERRQKILQQLEEERRLAEKQARAERKERARRKRREQKRLEAMRVHPRNVELREEVEMLEAGIKELLEEERRWREALDDLKRQEENRQPPKVMQLESTSAASSQIAKIVETADLDGTLASVANELSLAIKRLYLKLNATPRIEAAEQREVEEPSIEPSNDAEANDPAQQKEAEEPPIEPSNDNVANEDKKAATSKAKVHAAVLSFEDLGAGWTKKVVPRKNVKDGARTKDTFYFSPEGKKFRSLPEVARYLNGESARKSAKKNKKAATTKAKVHRAGASRKAPKPKAHKVARKTPGAQVPRRERPSRASRNTRVPSFDPSPATSTSRKPKLAGKRKPKTSLDAGTGEIFRYEARLDGPGGTPILGFNDTSVSYRSLKTGGLGSGNAKYAPRVADIQKGCYIHGTRVWLQTGNGEPVQFDKVAFQTLKDELIPVVDARAQNVACKGIRFLLKAGSRDGVSLKGFRVKCEIGASIANGGIGGNVNEIRRILNNIGDGVPFHDGQVWVVPCEESDGTYDFDTDHCKELMKEIQSQITSRGIGRHGEGRPTKWENDVPDRLCVPAALVGEVAGKGDLIDWAPPGTFDSSGKWKRRCRLNGCNSMGVMTRRCCGFCANHASRFSLVIQQEVADLASVRAADLSNDTVFDCFVGQVPLDDEDTNAGRVLASRGAVFHWVDLVKYAQFQRTKGKIAVLPSTKLSKATKGKIDHTVELKAMSDRVWGTVSFVYGRRHVQKHGRSRNKEIVLGKGDVRFVAVFTRYNKYYSLWTPFWTENHPNFVYTKISGGIVPCLLLQVKFTDESIMNIDMKIVELNGKRLRTPVDARKARLDVRDDKLVGLVKL